jgi:hypothetical protein
MFHRFSLSLICWFFHVFPLDLDTATSCFHSPTQVVLFFSFVARCTGAALSVALGLVEATCPQSSVGRPKASMFDR